MIILVSYSLSLFILLFFFSLIPPPPTSTLFPYTTLFRSHHVAEQHDPRRPCPLPKDAIPEVLLESRLWAVGDRKSTRLNSSHVAISYAVFCLKKKKKKRTQQ